MPQAESWMYSFSDRDAGMPRCWLSSATHPGLGQVDSCGVTQKVRRNST